MADWSTALEATALARGLRASVWAYPLVNAGHIIGVALLVGAIAPLDLRLLGLWPSVPLAALWRVLTRTAAVGLALAVFCGALLFSARASEYLHSTLFVSKMVLVTAGVVNALVLRTSVSVRQILENPEPVKMPPGARFAGGVSLAAWLAALILGRLVGYY